MNNKVNEGIFINFWDRYLEIEKIIYEGARELEINESEILRKTIYDLCKTNIRMGYHLEYLASTFLTKEELKVFEENSEMKRNSLQEILQKIENSRKK